MPTNDQSKGQLHVVFGPSALVMLTEALLSVGCNDDVVFFPDDLSIGPIDGASAEHRSAWMTRELRPHSDEPGFDLVPAEVHQFWETLGASDLTPVIWFTRYSAHEYSGFLELAWWLGDRPYRIVDFTGVDVVRRLFEGAGHRRPYLGLAEMMPSRAAGFLSSVQDVPPGQRDRYRQIWSKLRAENAALRVLTDGGLASEPISFFDDALLSVTPTEWQKIVRTIGEIWGLSTNDNVFQVCSAVLYTRIRTLIDEGQLECRGNIHDIRVGEIRRVQPGQEPERAANV